MISFESVKKYAWVLLIALVPFLGYWYAKRQASAQYERQLLMAKREALTRVTVRREKAVAAAKVAEATAQAEVVKTAQEAVKAELKTAEPAELATALNKRRGRASK